METRCVSKDLTTPLLTPRVSKTEDQMKQSITKTERTRPRRDSRRGSLLIVVLVTIVILSLSAYTFTALMQTKEEAARLVTRRIQSKYLVDSGADFVRLFLSNSEATIREKGGKWNNSQYFQAVPVAVETSNPNLIGYFSVITSSLDEEGSPEGFRFGLIDESSKINLNTLPYSDALFPGSARNILMALPEMTEEIADSILDWLDADDFERDYGTESAYYTGEDPAYESKNGPMDSLDEMLLVRGVTPQLMFGLDSNRNGILDPEEAASSDVSTSDADMYLGWANYMTLYSNETNLTGEGLERINVNADDLEQLYDDLKSAFNDEWANFVIYYRCAEDEPTSERPTEASAVIQKASLLPPDFDVLESKRKLNTIVDLVQAYVNVSDYDGENLTSYVESPIQFLNMGFTMPTMMASLTTYEGMAIPGRINIMQAPRRVLEGIPGLDYDIVDTIIYRRGEDFELDDPDGADMNRKFETWLLVEGIVDLPTMKSLMSFICTGGSVYRAEIVGYFADGAGTSRAEVVLDTTVPVPRILFWRDKSHLRGSFSIDAMGTNIVE
jgi:hypothetical protein